MHIWVEKSYEERGTPKKLRNFNWEHPWEDKNKKKLIKSITQSNEVYCIRTPSKCFLYLLRKLFMLGNEHK